MEQQNMVASPYDDKYIGANLRKWRKVMGLTQQELADRIGISKGRLSRIENEKVSITVGVLEIAASVLGLEVRVLMIDPGMIFAR